jgi:citrate synthase
MEHIKKGKIGNLDDPKLPYDYSKREYGTIPTDDKREPFRWVSEIAYKNVHRIVARGYDTTEVAEEGYGAVDMLFIDFQARIPTIEEEKMLNYIMILSLEDGLSMPAALSRIVAKSKTFLTQACGASILAFGHSYGAFSSFGNMLLEYMKLVEEKGMSLEDAVKKCAKDNIDSESFGISNTMLDDPSATKMIKRAEKLKITGKYTDFLKKLSKEAGSISKKDIDIDLLGAIGAVMMDMGFSPEAAWAIIAVTRSFGAGAHFIEEIETEEYIKHGQTLTPEEYYCGQSERPVPSLDERKKVAKSAQVKTPKEWKKQFKNKQKIQASGFSIIEHIEDPSKKTGA